MKRFSHVLVSTVFLALLIGCGDPVKTEIKASDGGSVAAGSGSGDGKIDIAPLRDFATKYEPAPGEGYIVPLLPVPPENVAKVLREHPIDDEYCRNVSLVILKLFRYHMENCHQSYDLREPNSRNPFVVAFARMARQEDCWEHTDYFGTDEVLNWVWLHPSYDHDKRIDSELKRVRAVRDQIEAELKKLEAKAATRAAAAK